MGLFTALWMMLLGVLGAANLIIAKKPDAKEIIGKISPYQGWIGAISAVWGAVIIIHAVLNLRWNLCRTLRLYSFKGSILLSKELPNYG